MDENKDHNQDNNISMNDIQILEKPPVQADQSARTTMRRHFTLFNVVAMLISITGHVAIFITPGSIVDMSGSIVNTIIILCIGAFLNYSLALCFTEIGSIFQSAGGPYLYLTLTFGNMIGFLTAWGYIILISGPIIAFTAQIAALYIVKAVILDMGCNLWWHDVAVHLLAGWLILSVAIMNCFYLKVMMKVQSFLTACKMVGIIIVITLGIYVLITDSSENFKEPLEGSHDEPGRISLALVYAIFSLGGWQAITTLTEEVKDPGRNLPRAIHITFAVVSSLFLLTYLSYMVVLEKHEIAQTKAVALLFCQRIWTPLVPVMSILVALACIGALSTGVMGHSRILFAAARKGDMPSVLRTLHPTHRTPMVAICAITIYGILMMYSGGMEKLMQFVGLYSLIMGFKVVVALLYLRYKKPTIARPYKVPLVFPLLQVLVCPSLFCLIIIQEPIWMSCGVLIYLAGIPVYLICVRWRHKPKIYGRFIGQVTGVIQKLFYQVPS